MVWRSIETSVRLSKTVMDTLRSVKIWLKTKNLTTKRLEKIDSMCSKSSKGTSIKSWKSSNSKWGVRTLIASWKPQWASWSKLTMFVIFSCTKLMRNLWKKSKKKMALLNNSSLKWIYKSSNKRKKWDWRTIRRSVSKQIKNSIKNTWLFVKIKNVNKNITKRKTMGSARSAPRLWRSSNGTATDAA